MAKVALTQEQKINQEAKKLTKKAKLILVSEGITQKELAEAIGVTPSEICYELNNVLRVRTLVAICQLTGRELLGGKEII